MQIPVTLRLKCGAPADETRVMCARTGRPLTHVLEVLKYIDRPAFDVLASKFRQYASCVGVVDTGYFRRRRDSDCQQLSMDDQLVEEDGAAVSEHLLTL